MGMHACRRLYRYLLGLMLFFAAAGSAAAQEPDVRQLAPWLELPATWSRTVESGCVVATPGDLTGSDTMRFWVEPPAPSDEDLLATYGRTTSELGDWKPVHPPTDYNFESGWAFHVGTGVVRTAGGTYTAVVAVGRKHGYLARFWALANSDATYNRHQGAVMVGIASVQDVDLAASPAPVVAAPAVPAAGDAVAGGTTPTVAPPLEAAPAAVALDPAFGTGISGAYVGLERGLRAGAGAGGMELTLDLSTNHTSVGASPGAPQLTTSIQDYAEVDVFFPDGSYRRSLPARGLLSDLAWDRANQGSAWGTWQRDGDRIVTRRGSYVTTYLVRGEVLQSERERPWRKLPAMGDTRLEGVFVRPTYRDPDAPRLVLHGDGTYEERGDMLRGLGTAFNLVVPDGATGVEHWSEAEARRWLGGGSGTYTLEAYTLTLRDRDGRVWQFSAYFTPTDSAQDTRQLVINEHVLVRD